MKDRGRSNKEFGDLVHDVWRSGGNPDAVNRDNFDYPPHDGEYDFVFDQRKLRHELKLQGK